VAGYGGAVTAGSGERRRLRCGCRLRDELSGPLSAKAVELFVDLIVPEQTLTRDGVHQPKPGAFDLQDQTRREAPERAVRLRLDRPVSPIHQPIPL
jgi:hypothetical protein